MTDNPTKLTASDLAALMCARVCHDLVSPIGALGTALEVLDDEANADMHADALDLVRLSAGQASAKLQYLRLAFGAGGSAPGVIGLETIKTLVHGMFGGGKVEFHWDNAPEGLDKPQARLVLNMVMMAMNAIPRGGEIRTSITTDDNTRLTLRATGLKSRLDPAVSRTLAGKAPDDGFDGRSIQPFYAGMIAREAKGTLTASIEDETVTFAACIPNQAAQNAA